MNSLIKEINENLKAIVDTLKETRDNSISTLDNIQVQMDKKVEEAKKYKVQVDSAKEKIKALEEDNKSLELSLNELSDKYGKMNLVSIVEAGNREIKLKINDNLKEINKQKEHIAELTNKARTIKDLLINLKKDRTIKEERLENIKVVYEYYNDRINEIIDYAFDHSENLMDYKSNISFVNFDEEESESSNPVELENTMVFDEIANIDENKNFKDEMTFINEQIDNSLNEEKEKINDIIKRSLSDDFINNIDEEIESASVPIDTTQVFDSIIDNIEEDDEEAGITVDEVDNKEIEEVYSIGDESTDSDNEVILQEEISNDVKIQEEQVTTNEVGEDKFLDEENEMRINKINDLFSSFENTNNSDLNNNLALDGGVVEKIDNAYMDVFGQPLEEDDLNKKEPTLTDIFGNPIETEELSEEVKIGKKIEELFVENGIDFNKFREDEKNYLKQIYNEDKFNNIINVLKRNKINLDNIYNAFNIFGEISENELENLISKLLNVGQSVEAIGIVLEKLPKVKKYNLDEAIISYGEYVKNVDMTELIMKAKELYKNGGND